MTTNNEITIYHKMEIDRENKWVKYNYRNAWVFFNQGSTVNKGYTKANSSVARIPYENNTELNIKDFSIGDIVCLGNIQKDITSQNELLGIEFFNITSITNNIYGNNPHIHLTGE